MKLHQKPLLGFRPGTLAVGLTLGIWAGGVQSAFAQCETLKLLAFDGEEGDFFGRGISVSQEILVIGASNKNEPLLRQGTAYVYRKDPLTSAWLFESKLHSSRDWWNGSFGFSVSVNGDRIAVGAPLASDVDFTTGVAFVFRYDSSLSSWIEEAVLRAGSCDAFPIYNRFGTSVSLFGNFLVVGAPHSYGDSVGPTTGSACVFRYDGAAWIVETTLFAPDGASGDWFGYHVSTGDNVVLIGSDGHSANGQYAGAVYVYRYNTVTLEWALEAKLMPSDAESQDFFGWSVDLDGDVAIIGSYGNNDSGENSGSAYIFRYDTITSMWTEEAKLLPANGAAHDLFGVTAVISNNVAIIGATRGDGIIPDSGSVYRFHFDGTSWNEEVEFYASDSAPPDESGFNDSFGRPIALSEGLVYVGAIFDDDRGISSGSAYIFESSNATCCPADTNGNGEVSVFDLLELLSAWGACPVPCPPDHNRDGFVNVTDLLKLLSSWGTCP